MANKDHKQVENLSDDLLVSRLLKSVNLTDEKVCDETKQHLLNIILGDDTKDVSLVRSMNENSHE